MTRVGHSHTASRNAARSWQAGFLTVAFTLGCVVATPHTANAATPPLGTAANFAVLAGTVTTNTGPTVVTGDLGVSPGSVVTGFPPGIVVGAVHAADATAAQAQLDLTAAYDDAAGQPVDATLPTELGGTTVTPGAYDSATGAFAITGEFTLDGQNDPNAVFILKTTSDLVTTSASTVNLVNGAQACNVFWQVGGSATLGPGSSFAGNILALISITVATGANVAGRLLAREGAVTLDTGIVTTADCAVSPPRETATTLATACSRRGAGRLVLTANVIPSGPTAPTGSAEFFSDGVSLGTAPIGTNGRTLLPVTGIEPGTHLLVAAFPGNTDLDPSASTPQPLVVGRNALCPAQAQAQTTAAGNRKNKGGQSIKNRQHSGNAIKIRDRKRGHHRHRSWARCCRHPR
ncbi:ice-binding family protein [Streptosporangium sp. NPDC006930]|uniref:ice-binding family protein n=1 Tax=unclassified Streptosporangium TaxID=2632669 RepID=UPI003445459A